jgi:hypothetical protein
MKTYKRWWFKRLNVEIGWFPGEEWVLFQLSLFEVMSDYPSGIGCVELLGLRLFKFALSITLDFT